MNGQLIFLLLDNVEPSGEKRAKSVKETRLVVLARIGKITTTPPQH
jgi:hypothetical protein